MNPLVSICIPAYQQPELLERCLSSIVQQTWKEVEVHVTDDTPGNGVKIVVDRFMDRLKLSYHKNATALGSPANWNAALANAKGDYVLLLHHDDAFASPDSLSQFLQPFQKNPTVDFVFGRNASINKLAGGKPFGAKHFFLYYREPELLLTGNFIGAPSNVLLKATAVERYNPSYKWIVDFEFYIRLFRKKRQFFYIDRELVTIGIHEGQVTNECIDNHDVLLFEYISFALQSNLQVRNRRLYDFYWRLLRNAGIRSSVQLTKLGFREEDLPAFIRQMISAQRLIPASVLQMGFVSKPLMMLNFLLHRPA
jgi:glycosyltransferase involved in cell wall biosynthesis